MGNGYINSSLNLIDKLWKLSTGMLMLLNRPNLFYVATASALRIFAMPSH